MPIDPRTQALASPGLFALLAALQGGGQPQGNIANLPPVTPGAIPGATNTTPEALLQALSPEMHALLGPVGQTAAAQSQRT